MFYICTIKALAQHSFDLAITYNKHGVFRYLRRVGVLPMGIITIGSYEWWLEKKRCQQAHANRDSRVCNIGNLRNLNSKQ